MKKIKNTLSIWWASSSPWVRFVGVWSLLAAIGLLIVIGLTQIGLKILMVVLVLGVPATTFVGLLLTIEGLVKANNRRKRDERIASAYGTKYRS